MKLICQKQKLIHALNIVLRAVPARTTMPILKGILLKAYPDGRLILSSSNIDFSIQNTIAVDVIEPGEVVIQAKLFSDIVRKLPGVDLELSCDIGNTATIKSMNAVFNIITDNADEFPLVNKLTENTKTIKIDRDILKKMIDKTVFATSNDESRGILQGLKMEMSNGNINLIGLDAYRMAIARDYLAEPQNHSFIINGKIMSDFSKILSEIDNDSEKSGILYLDNKKAIFRFNNIQAELKLMSGEYIDYKNIIPSNLTTEVIINTKDMINGIERASLFSSLGKHNLIKFCITDNVMTIKSTSEEGFVAEDILIEKTGEDIEIGFNALYLMEAIKSISDEKFKMTLRSVIDPCLLMPLEGNGFEHLILPVRM